MSIRNIAIGFIVVMAFVGGMVWNRQMAKAPAPEMAAPPAGAPGGDMGGQMGGGMPGMPAEAAPHPGVEWKTPGKWKDQGPRSMRVATYSIPKSFGDSDDAECAVFYFGQGQGGGVDENIARWVGQFENASQPERANTTVGEFKVHRVTVNGSFLAPAGPMMQSSGTKPKWRLLGAIIEGPQGSVFFKLTGPEKTVKGAEKDFEALLASLHP